MPKKAARIARAFGAVMWKPRRNIAVVEKIKLAQRTKTRNSHERDALAAALCAKKHYSSLFARTEKKLRIRHLEPLSDTVKAIVVKERVPIAKAIGMV